LSIDFFVYFRFFAAKLAFALKIRQTGSFDLILNCYGFIFSASAKYAEAEIFILLL